MTLVAEADDSGKGVSFTVWREAHLYYRIAWIHGFIYLDVAHRIREWEADPHLPENWVWIDARDRVGHDRRDGSYEEYQRLCATPEAAFVELCL